MKSLHQVLSTEAEVKATLALLLDEVLEKQNYDLRIEGEIHFDECEPTEAGYIMGSFVFLPWGADAFQVMQQTLEQVVDENYISIELTIHNLHHSLEDRVRSYFNETFNGLDEARSAGTIYVGDNGEVLARYLDVDAQQLADILDSWKHKFADMMVTIYRTDDNSADVSIC